MTSPVFHGFEEESRCVILRGPFGAPYRLSTAPELLQPFQHGEFVRHVPTSRVAVVLGELNSRIWVQFQDENFATPLDAKDAATALEPAASASGDIEFEGPLGVSYPFDTQELDDVFDVRAGSQHYVKLWEATVSFVGCFLKVPWVRILRGPPRFRASQCAVPLTECFTGDALRSLYCLCEVPTTPGAGLVETPRTKQTPRSGGSAPPFKLVALKRKAICNAPLGATIEADTSDAALRDFGLRHGERLLALRGVSAGRLATVVGVSAGTLIVHVDGDSKVTLVRGCCNAAELAVHFARPKGGNVDVPNQTPAGAVKTVRPAAATPAAAEVAAVSRSATAGKASGSAADGSMSKVKPKAPFKCWTAFGRYEFNTASAAVQVFGPFTHEDVVRCTVGPAAGKLFHIVGERTGTLWVIEANKLRATPLLHCATAADVQRTYGFVHHGRSSLKAHAEREDEPPPTPFNSPRSGRRSLSREDDTPRALQDSSSRSHGVPPARVEVPPIKGMNLTRQLGPAFDAAAVSETPVHYQQPSAAHHHNDPEIAASFVSSSGVVSLGSGQSARNYLKAVAMFMLGTTNQQRTPLPFHEYYAVDPTKRIGAALRKLDHTKEAWSKIHPTKSFADATIEDILRLFAKYPQLLP